MPRKLILENFLSPGDIVMLTAAVRDLHRCNPGAFLTDVRTSAAQLWENNPFITSLADDDPQAEHILCEYPLIHQSNTRPLHFIHGFSEHLSERLNSPLRLTEFRGDIHLTIQEKSWLSQVQELTGVDVPFWIIVAGGKNDFTIKWWDFQRFQEIVNHFRSKILFVQVGDLAHHHPALSGVLDLRGKTDIRQLVRLVYHAEGVLCPVTFLMHLAAAVETRPDRPPNRACVVVAGGREPAHWEAYPHHQFLHTNGALRCCEQGGCWKSRTQALGDGDEKDRPENLCHNTIQRPSSDAASAPHFHLPSCMDLITSADTINRIELYFKGGCATYLTPTHREILRSTLPELLS